MVRGRRRAAAARGGLAAGQLRLVHPSGLRRHLCHRPEDIPKPGRQARRPVRSS